MGTNSVDKKGNHGINRWQPPPTFLVATTTIICPHRRQQQQHQQREASPVAKNTAKAVRRQQSRFRQKNKATTTNMPRRRHSNRLPSSSSLSQPPTAVIKATVVWEKHCKGSEKEVKQLQTKNTRPPRDKNHATTVNLHRLHHSNRLASLASTVAAPSSREKQAKYTGE
uniref:Uncharacterized protein n=1 Tax=Populus alba TaxID=43335 RepID=A0A4U5PPC5_POPAL|nr:hypothetical protein D5086_0000200900 [Populus alba]